MLFQISSKIKHEDSKSRSYTKMNLHQKEQGYRYNSDTLLLYDFISNFKPKGTLLDVGCGCGILGLLVKRDFPSISLHLLDIQEENCTLTHTNATHNTIAFVSLTCKDFLVSSFTHTFDMIVSNPPFYHQGVVKSENEHLSISRHSSYLPFEHFALKVGKMLSNKGYFLFCYDAKQLDTLCFCLHKAGLKIENLRFVHTKASEEASLVLVRARKNSKTLCAISPPLISMDEMGYTAEVQAIFKQANTQSIQCKS